jgi:hypothetical protein
MSKTVSLLALPRELRDEIYAHVLYPPSSFSYYIPSSPSLPGICQTNRQLRHETLPVYISLSKIRFVNTTNTEEVQRWLSEFEVNGQFGDIYAVVHSVEVCWLGERNADREMQFLQRCNNLRDLKIHLRIDVSTRNAQEDEDEDRAMARNPVFKTNTLQEVLATHHLAMILNSTSLEKLEFLLTDVPGYNSLRKSMRERWAFMGRLNDWFVEQWALLGKRNVEVRCEVEIDESDDSFLFD